MKPSIGQRLFKKLGRVIGLHPDVGALISGGMKLTNPGQASFPAENLHFASRVIASGMWNYCFFQFYRHFAGPYWVERQYNPEDLSFTPRAGVMLSVNVTHRTWMGFRGPDSSYFSLVDPAGAISPVIGYYSLEFAIKEGEKLYLPTRKKVKIKQRPFEDLPVPETLVESPGVRVRVRATGAPDKMDMILMEVEYEKSTAADCELIVSIRPFHPEGASLIHHLMYSSPASGGGSISVNREEEIRALTVPDRVHFSNLEAGDAYFTAGFNEEVFCPFGISTGILSYRLKRDTGSYYFTARTYERDPVKRPNLPPLPVFKNTNGHEAEFPTLTASPLPKKTARVEKKLKLKHGGELQATGKTSFLEYQELARNTWRERLSRGAKFNSARSGLNRAAKVFSAYVNELHANREITPGVFTYRQFFFRDAAYMISALARWNFVQDARHILETYPERQLRNGFFRSQEGEWDSNGQAIWSLVDYAILSGDKEFLKKVFHSLKKGADWIVKKRKQGPEKKIMPPGFSAEHLGPADHYYWDNIWGIAGLIYTAKAARVIGERELQAHYQKEAEDYIRDFQDISADDRKQYGVLTAAPGRPVDSGMIGCICLLYPLELDILPKAQVRKTVLKIYNKYFNRGLFFHPIIHSGYNIYLSIQMAQCLFRLGEVKKARRILNRVLKRRSDLWTYPEAIHPLTEGGVMGDGFHGWAFAEILLLIREFVVHKNETTLEVFKGLRKKELFGENLAFGPFPLEGTSVEISGSISEKGGRLRIIFPRGRDTSINRLRLHLPGLKKNEVKLIAVQGCQAIVMGDKVLLAEMGDEVSLEYKASA